MLGSVKVFVNRLCYFLLVLLHIIVYTYPQKLEVTNAKLKCLRLLFFAPSCFSQARNLAQGNSQQNGGASVAVGGPPAIAVSESGSDCATG
jgi:hypothetical protein